MGNTHFIIATLADAEHDTLISEFSRLRKRVFVDESGWSLPAMGSVEFDEYDRLDAYYILAVDQHDGKVVGGARLIRTSAEVESCSIVDHPFSYMIRDAYLGRLDGLPTEICFEEPPVDESVWELTRFVTDGSAMVGQEILMEANKFLEGQGAWSCLFLGHPSFMRLAKKMGLNPEPIGKVIKSEEGTYLSFKCDVLRIASNDNRRPNLANTN